MSIQDHWNRAYLNNPLDKLGWYTPHLATSMKWINEHNLGLDASIIDVGGGADTLAAITGSIAEAFYSCAC